MSRTGERRRGIDRDRAIAIALAIVAHALALALLAWTTPALKLPSIDFPPDVTLDLRPLTLPRESSTASAARSRAAREAQTPRLAPAPVYRAPTPRTLAAKPQQPSPAPPTPPARAAAPRAGDTGPPGPPATSPGLQLQDKGGGDPRGAVRAAIGCSHEDFLRLSAAERDACQRRMAEQPRIIGPKLDLIDPLKRKAYDQQAAADARRRDHEGPMSAPVIPCSGVGSNFGVGCVPPEAMHSARGGATPRSPAPDVLKPEAPAP